LTIYRIDVPAANNFSIRVIGQNMN
jgi:hypothetical protein